LITYKNSSAAGFSKGRKEAKGTWGEVNAPYSEKKGVFINLHGKGRKDWWGHNSTGGGKKKCKVRIEGGKGARSMEHQRGRSHSGRQVLKRI